MSFGFTRGTDPTTPGASESVGSSSQWTNSSGSGSTDPASVWGGQAPYLQDLYGQAQQQFGNVNTAGAQGIYDQATAGFNQLMNPGINPQLEAYQRQVQQNMERNILPTIQGQAGMYGQMGGSRQGVAQGLAMGDANQQITDMAANLYGQDMDRMGQAMSQAPGLAQFGESIPWFGLQQYSGLLGAPTVLGGGSRYETESSGGGSSSTVSSGTTASGGGGGGGANIGLW